MINEEAVVVAKFWKRLQAISSDYPRQYRQEFEYFALKILAYLSLESSDRSLKQVSFDATMTFKRLSAAAQSKDSTAFQDVWAASEAMLNDATDSLSSNKNSLNFDGRKALYQISDLVTQFQNDERTHTRHLLFFDEVFHQVTSSEASIKYRNSDAAAALAAELSSESTEVIDYFPVTAEFLVLRKFKNVGVSNAAAIGPVEQLEFPIKLRLMLYNVEATTLPPRLDNVAYRFQKAFLLIDHPKREISPHRNTSDALTEQYTALQALDYLLTQDAKFDAALIVVPGSDRTSQGWRKQLRQHLVLSGMLLAVIDLPGDERKSKSQTSAWLITTNKHDNEGILFLDANQLSRTSDLTENDRLMAFIAGAVSIAIPRGWASPLPIPRSRVASEYRAMLDAYFRDGYRDVDGLCKLLTRQEVSHRGSALTAARVVQTSNHRRSWIPLIDSEAVRGALDQAGPGGIRAYVIGNNGEGKSMLLADLVDHLSQQNHPTVGISFGLTDRFSFTSSTGPAGLFTYVGARTTEGSIALRRTSIAVTTMIRDIHINPTRLSVFSSIVELLGFGERRYLVPTEVENNSSEDRTEYARLERLSDEADDNAQIFRGLALSKNVLGLMRKTSDSVITTFSKLSSGEQQLLTLAIKVTAHADRNTVILIDEPELSLHVSWQRAIPAMLDLVGSRLGCSIVIATHSPVIVASANHSNDRCFVARNRALTELATRDRRSVETALFEGFRTYTANNRQIAERCASMVSSVIKDLNEPQKNAGLDLKHYLDELELMQDIIRNAESAQLNHTEDDLALISRTRAAVTEIFSVSRESRV